VPTPRYALLNSPKLFGDPLHKPFRLDGDGSRVAILVHGFPGTPREMRALGAALHSAGWSVTVPLLPGFGPEIATLPDRRHGEWRDAVCRAIAEARAAYGRVVLIGYSTGAAVALLAAERTAVDAQVLLAPYWRFGSPLGNALWPVLRIWAGKWKPLGNADFNDERIRSGVLRMLPDLDLNDATVRDELSRFTMPTQLLDEMRRLGSSARKAAAQSSTKTLVVQGLRDELVQPKDTDALLKAIFGAKLELLDATHYLLSPTDGAWERLTRVVCEFLDG
jgi:esterase/lipase